MLMQSIYWRVAFRRGYQAKLETQAKITLLVLLVVAPALAPMLFLTLVVLMPIVRIEAVVFDVIGRLSLLVDGLEAAGERSRSVAPRRIVIAIPLGEIPNRALLKAYAEKIWILAPDLVAIQQSMLLMPGWLVPKHRHIHMRGGRYGEAWLHASPRRRRDAGRRKMALGVAEGSHAVFSFSDHDYYQNVLNAKAASQHRRKNSDLDSLLPHLNFLQASQISVLRVGKSGTVLSDSHLESCLIDAQVNRDENSELALISTARLGWSDTSGAWWAWMSFGIPILLTNAFSLSWRSGYLPENVVYLPVLWQREDGSLLTFGETIREGNSISKNHVTRAGEIVNPIKNDGNLIRSALLETMRMPHARRVRRSESGDVAALRDRLTRVFERNNTAPNIGMGATFLQAFSHLIVD